VGLATERRHGCWRPASSGLGDFLARKGELMTDLGLLFGRLADYLKIALLAAG
jgi:hypothetical protein